MEESSSQFVWVSITAPNKDQADKIAEALVTGRLAACAQVFGPITSFFWWEGKVNKEPEYFIFLKTKDNNLAAIREALHNLHSYQVPELIALPIVAGSQDYLQWLSDTLTL